jgi:radical SAM protein (TIGR04043 family)/putative N-acetyltransferase (TIGR04045 family)
LEPVQDHWALFRGNERIDLSVTLPPKPPFYSLSTADGVPYRQIALMHGIDCLASTVLQACSYWGTKTACRFCGVGLSWKAGRTRLRKDPALLAEVAKEARKAGAQHVTLTAGSTRDRLLEWQLFRESAQAISTEAGLPVHVQLLPPVPARRMERLREDGVASVGIHLESFDRHVLKEMAPCKASIPLEAYVQAWKEAVRIFGRNQVSSFLLMGLGEDPQSLLEGCERLASIGVYPYLVPFRPIPGTPLAGREPIRPGTAKRIYRKAARILEEHDIYWRDMGAGCVRCRGCSALPDYQDALLLKRKDPEATEAFELKVIERGPLLEASFAIRREVFVEEQGMFRDSDRDEMDPASLHILALKGGECVGTVRITPLGEGNWLGSRLAVRAPFRGQAGALLVKRAEEEVKRRGGRRFRAYIQSARVAFFERCDWRALERIPEFHGRPHVLMAAAGPLWKRSRSAPYAGRRESHSEAWRLYNGRESSG